MKAQGIVEYALILVLVAVVVIVVLAVLASGITTTQQHTYPPTVSQLLEDCVESGTSASAIGGVGLVSVNENRIIDCLYSNGITLNYHGDPVKANNE